MPASPKPYIDLNKIDHGVMFEGSQGTLIADFGSRILLPLGDKSNLTYYKPYGKDVVLHRFSIGCRECVDPYF